MQHTFAIFKYMQGVLKRKPDLSFNQMTYLISINIFLGKKEGETYGSEII